MGVIFTGNLSKQKNSHRGWFIGHFIKQDSCFYNDNFEVKWGVHKKGEKKAHTASNKTAKTLDVLIKGKFAVKFPEDKREIILSKVGDYVFFDAGVYHTSEALNNSIILTIRWPSVEGDQVPL